MKLTEEFKEEVENMTVGMIGAKFRFYPSYETTGESGKYLIASLRKKLDEEKRKNSNEQERKIFGIA